MSTLFRFCSLAVIISLLSGSFIGAHAQDDAGRKDYPIVTLRTNPLSFLENDGNIMLGVGYQWHQRWAMAIDPGYIFFTPYNNSETSQVSSMSGIKVRADVRYFFEKSRKGLFNTFVAPEFHYKYVRSRKWEDFGINCLGGQCDYYQRAEYTEIKKEMGAALKIGTILPLGNGRFNVEVYGGLGFKFKRFVDTDLPLGGSFVNPPDHSGLLNTNGDPDAAYFILPAGVKFTYRVR
jgi:hypothetical protein